LEGEVIKTTIRCDRCGKELSYKNELGEVNPPVVHLQFNGYNLADLTTIFELCQECAREVDLFASTDRRLPDFSEDKQNG
jgi:DNA-directed RNA polymerase subunit RPC12/RpoP